MRRWRGQTFTLLVAICCGGVLKCLQDMAVVSVLPISPRTCRYICPSTQPTNSELTIPRRPNQCRPLTISPSFHPSLLLPPTTSHTPLPLSSPHTPASPPSPPQRSTHHANLPSQPKTHDAVAPAAHSPQRRSALSKCPVRKVAPTAHTIGTPQAMHTYLPTQLASISATHARNTWQRP